LVRTPICDFAAAFCDSALRHLVLRGCAITDAAAPSMGALAKGLVSLDLCENPISDACAEAIAGAFEERNLETLDVSRTDVGPRGASALADAVCKLATTAWRDAASSTETSKVVVRLTKGGRIPEAKATAIERKVDMLENEAFAIEFVKA